jgi:ABC-type nitrate/sulfonate/bicarbonate transport system substrate-binding protein
MQAFCLSVAVLLVSLCECVQAEKLTLAHVAVNPSQGIFWVAKDSGILAKYGFTADIVLIPGTPRTVQALIAGDLDYAVAGSPAALRARMQGADVVMLVFRGIARPLKGASARELGFKGVDGPLSTTERKIKADRGAVLRVVQAYVEAIHYVKTNKAGTIRIFQRYMRGLSEEDLGTWLDDSREGLRSLPYPDEEALRAELDQIGAPKSQSPAAFLNTTFLDELKKNGFVDKLYR